MEGSTGRNRPTLVATVAAAGIVQLPTAAIVVALPTIHAQFDTSIAELQWTVTAFYIPFAAFLIASGRLADVFGRRRLLIAGSLIFSLGSGLAMVAPGAPLLIAGIALAGIGGSMLIPSSMSLVTNVFSGERRALAIGMWGAATELVSGIGVLVGGVLTGELSWRWIFGVDVAVALSIAVVALLWVPESRDPKAERRVDLRGAALSASALTALTLALIQGASWGWGSVATISLVAVSLLLFAAFFVTEARSRQPLIELEFFKRRNFTGATTTVFVIDFSFGALLFFLPLYFQEILAYSATETGLILLPLTGLMVIASPLGGKVAARVGPRPPIVAGLLMMAGAVLWISTLDLGTTYADLWLPTAIMGFGIGFALTPMNLAAMNAVPQEHTGAAAGLLVTLSGLGSTLGVAVTGAVFQELQTDRTISLVDDTGVEVSRETAQQLTGVLAGSPGGEKTLEQVAGGSEVGAVETAVREAFVSALGTSLKLSAALILLGALVAAALMRRSSPGDAAASAQPVGSASPRPAPLGAGAASV
ncbi:MAG: MFS transporter [Solirubrobacterales bacterium]